MGVGLCFSFPEEVSLLRYTLIQWFQRFDGTGTPRCLRQMGIHINHQAW